MKPLYSFDTRAAAGRLLSRLRTWIQNPSWRSRYARAQHGRGVAPLRRRAVDLALLGGIAMLPATILFWSAENEQQQLARMPLERTNYVEGWTMTQTQSHVFFDAPSVASRQSSLSKASDEASQGWSFRCGLLYKTASSSRPPSEQQPLATPTRRLLCDEGARVAMGEATLSTQSLIYEKEAQGYRLTTESPVSVQEGENRLSSLGGGFVEELREEHRVVVFKRDVVFSFQAPLNRYRGAAQEAMLLPCKGASKVGCRVFGNDALRRIILAGSVVVAGEDHDKTVLWTLQAERVVVEDGQARYHGKKRDGRLGSVRIVLADGTQLRGRHGGHDLSDESGLLCGAVEVRSGEGVLTGACLRYNLKEQRYTLESAASERELGKRFFAL